MPEKCIFTNISDQAKNNEMKVVGGWEFELGERELAKIADANVWRPTSMVAVRWSLARHGNNIFKLE